MYILQYACPWLQPATKRPFWEHMFDISYVSYIYICICEFCNLLLPHTPSIVSCQGKAHSSCAFWLVAQGQFQRDRGKISSAAIGLVGRWRVDSFGIWLDRYTFFGVVDNTVGTTLLWLNINYFLVIKEDLEPFRWELLSVELWSTIQRHW